MPRRSKIDAGLLPKDAARKQSVKAAKDKNAPKSSLLCRTCQRCRLKKIKCSGERPRCASCVASEHECKYPADARRSNRITKADTKALQNEILALRRLVSERRDHGLEYDQSTASLETAAPFMSGDSTSFTQVGGLEHGAEVLDPALTLERIDVQPGSDAALPTPTQAPFSLHTPRESVSGSSGQRTRYVATPRASDQAFHDPSPREIYITGTVTNSGQIRAYGVTSTLHEGPPAFPETDSPAEDDEARNIRHQLIRDQLVSNAVIQRQRETSVLHSRQINPTIELDGLPPALAAHLFNLHWNRQHYSYLLTYRPAIMDSLMNGGPYANKLLLNAIYYSSSLYCDEGLGYRDTGNLSSDHFYRRFKELLVDEIDQPSTPTATALLLCGASLVSHGKQSAGWVLCGTAYRMIVDLGCHLVSEEAQQMQPLGKSNAIEFEIDKRLYWGAYMTDKFQSLYLGRSPALRVSDAQIPSELLDSYEELEMWEPYRGEFHGNQSLRGEVQITYIPQPAYAVSTFSSLLQLAKIANHVIDVFYSKDCLKIPVASLKQARADLEHQLDEWRENLPRHLHFDHNSGSTPPPHQITLHTTYWTLVILLERPFLDSEHLNHVSDASSEVMGEERCTTSVLQIWSLVKVYKDTFTLRRAPYLLCYATYSAVLVILRQANRNRERYSECIPLFWTALLDLQQGCNAGLKKPLKILKTLMTRLGADIPQLAAIAGEKGAKGHGLPDTNGEYVAVDAGVSMTDPQGEAAWGQGLPSADVFDSLNLDLGNIDEWLGTEFGEDASILDDSMYGLFTSQT